ncbi:hypothetical protein LRAMOSA04116 [Lichtheimia ramosa]|uniref:Uncharacterized protein n=1 Tax=Lichtheimia ramosa TaxID=688394 RepID=A0A077WXD6_9FUNG|nr:hypothetical protein LRAMOSA04116 [Lichtheimia ramosa]
MAELAQERKSLTDLLAKSLQRPCFARQRFQLSPDKERDLFMAGLLNKVDRLQSCRLINQDAEPPRDELDDILSFMCRTEQVLNNQRATLTAAI